MKTSPITWAIIRSLTRRGKRHVKELRSNCARAGELNRELLMRTVHDNRDTSFMFSVFMTNLVDMMVYIQRNWEMLVEDIRVRRGRFFPDHPEP